MTDTGDNNVLRPQESKYQNIFRTLCISYVAKAQFASNVTTVLATWPQ